MSALKPAIYLVAGCNWAGKTTFARKFLPSVGVIRFLNADEIARGLSPLRSEVVAFKLEGKLVRETRERNCGYLSILWNRRVMLLTDMPAVRFGDDPRTLI